MVCITHWTFSILWILSFKFHLLPLTNMISKMSMRHWDSCVWELCEKEWGQEGPLRREETVENKTICFMGAQRCVTHHPIYAKFPAECQAHFQEMKIVWSYLRGMPGSCFSGPGTLRRRQPSRQILDSRAPVLNFLQALLFLVSFSG